MPVLWYSSGVVITILDNKHLTVANRKALSQMREQGLQHAKSPRITYSLLPSPDVDGAFVATMTTNERNDYGQMREIAYTVLLKFRKD